MGTPTGKVIVSYTCEDVTKHNARRWTLALHPLNTGPKRVAKTHVRNLVLSKNVSHETIMRGAPEATLANPRNAYDLSLLLLAESGGV